MSELIKNREKPKREIGVGRRILAIAVLGVSAHFALNTAVSLINRNLTSESETVVFTAGDSGLPLPNEVEARFIDFFMYTPITLRQNMHGSKVKWVTNASRNQVSSLLQNPKYQNVVLIGHGSRSSYGASDGEVFADELASLNLPPRRGEFIQHTCGSYDDEVSLRDTLFPEGSRGYGFNSEISPLTNYLRAWEELITDK